MKTCISDELETLEHVLYIKVKEDYFYKHVEEGKDGTGRWCFIENLKEE